MTPMLICAQFFCAAYMTGIIWFVQLVHYPMLHHSNGADTKAGHAEYTHRMGRVVIPVMLAEMGIQAWWALAAPSYTSLLGLSFLVVIWLSTFLLQVPTHQKLQLEFNAQQQRYLLHTNWIRTVLWTARALLLASVCSTTLT
ncbi:hypothetical protein P3T73_04730 [Kiritimatiellota bacterium B12222]|nr:hypothetical protein P3T73_04730 [Kiritimatiellota bacterium B12222]